MSRKKIAIITAPNMRYVNTGMTTVELAAKSFLKRAQVDADIDFYSVIPPNPPGPAKWMMMDLGYVHKSAAGIAKLFEHKPLYGNLDRLFASDLIIYWGDFLQARHYIDAEATDRLAMLYGLERHKAQEFAYQSLLLSGAPKSVTEKTIVFGSSLLYNGVSDYIAGQYAEDISALARNCRYMALRDPISGARVNHLTGDFSRTHLGIDPAFFLAEEDLGELPAGAWSDHLQYKKTIGLFFGTRTKPPKRLLDFCRNVADKLGLDLEWTPWFPYHDKLRQESKPKMTRFFQSKDRSMLDDIEKMLPRGDAYTQGDLLKALRKYSLVITDTYHLCINAWNAGTPAICFGSEAGSANNVIKDFKKRVLYEMFDAKDFYFDTAVLEAGDRQAETERHVVKLFNDEALLREVCKRITAQASSVGMQLRSHVNGVLT